MRVTGLRFPASRPALGRLAHIRAVLAVRLSIQDGGAYQQGRAWWRSERRIRAADGGRVGVAHVPDAEISWPDTDASAYAGECWAIEAELTPKPLARTTAIMTGLLARTSRYPPGTAHGHAARYARVVYLAAPAARPVVDRAAAALPGRLAIGRGSGPAAG